MTGHTAGDDRLVDALEEALKHLKAGENLDREAWKSTHPGLDDDGGILLDTLILLSTASSTWRDDQSHDGASESDDLTRIEHREPTVIGRYQIRGPVGEGAMGEVFDAYDPQLTRRVAIKVPHCEKLEADRKLFTRRFLLEARAAAAVRHSHICPVYDAGEHNGRPYVVMAFVEGKSLESVLSRGPIADLRTAVEMTAQVADALHAIHQHGIIHRDLKPGNILIDQSGQALLTDFGLAVSTINPERLTRDGLIVGTPVYMSPEQAAGENSTLTLASDIYSLGAVFYEILTGVVPFRAPLLEVLRQIKTEMPAPPTSLRPDLDPRLSDIAIKAMAKVPSERFTTAEQMAQALRAWLVAAHPNSAHAPLSHVASQADGQSTKSKWWLATSAAVLLISLVLAFVRWPEPPIDGKTESAMSGSSGVVSTPMAGASVPAPNNADKALSGEFEILISSDPQRGPIEKQRLRIEDQRAYPLHNGELVQFEVHLNQPAYVYLLWVSPDGSVTALYPWDAERSTAGFAASRVPGSEHPIDHLLCPSNRKVGFEAGEPIGLQTFLLLARKSPLPNEVDMAQILAGLPSLPETESTLAVRRPRLRGIVTGQTKALDQPLFSELESRLAPHFELLRMMTFPQVRE